MSWQLICSIGFIVGVLVASIIDRLLYFKLFGEITIDSTDPEDVKMRIVMYDDSFTDRKIIALKINKNSHK